MSTVLPFAALQGAGSPNISAIMQNLLGGGLADPNRAYAGGSPFFNEAAGSWALPPIPPSNEAEARAWTLPAIPPSAEAWILPPPPSAAGGRPPLMDLLRDRLFNPAFGGFGPEFNPVEFTRAWQAMNRPQNLMDVVRGLLGGPAGFTGGPWGFMGPMFARGAGMRPTVMPPGFGYPLPTPAQAGPAMPLPRAQRAEYEPPGSWR